MPCPQNAEFQEFLNVMENKKRAESVGDGAEICEFLSLLVIISVSRFFAFKSSFSHEQVSCIGRIFETHATHTLRYYSGGICCVRR